MRTEVPSLCPAPRVTFGEAISFREHRLGNDIMHIDEYLVGMDVPIERFAPFLSAHPKQYVPSTRRTERRGTRPERYLNVDTGFRNRAS